MPHRVGANPHLATETLLAGAPEAEAGAAAVLVHGRGEDHADGDPTGFMLELAARLDLPEVAYLIPTAAGRSWYPGRFHEPVEHNEPWVSRSLEAIDAALERAAGHDRGPGRVALLGFSQGGCLVAERLARGPVGCAAAAALTGALIGPPGAPRSGMEHLRGFPILCTTAEQDEWVPLSSVEETVSIFREAGAEVTLRALPKPEHAHIGADEIADIRALVGPLLG